MVTTESLGEIKPGQVVFDIYRILKLLGEGGMGRVYLAENINLQTKWAIKEIPVTEKNATSLLTEHEILKNLSHHALPRIVNIYPFADRLFIVMDYLTGESMDAYLEAHRRVDEQTALRWARQMCDLLGYLHRQQPPIIYRDMKPGNLIIDPDGDIRLVDFGISQRYSEVQIPCGPILLTRGYAPPEQHKGAAPEPRMDIFSMGVTLHRMLSGRNPDASPYYPCPLRELVPGLSEGIEFIVAKCTAESPDARYQTVVDVEYDIIHIHTLNHQYRRAIRAKNIRILFFSGLLVLFCALTALGFRRMSSDRVTRYETLIEQGADAVTAGDLDLADGYVSEATALFPEKPQAYLSHANALAQQYRYNECLAYITDTVLPQLPGAAESAELNSLLGAVYYNVQNYREAAHYFSQAAQLQPDNTASRRDLVVCLLRDGDIAALEDLEIDYGEQPAPDLSYLAGLTNLRYLSLEAANVQNLTALQGLKQLQQVNITSENKVDYSALLKMEGLTGLSLGHLEQADIKRIVALNDLGYFSMYDSHIDSLDALLALENLYNLRLSNCTVGDFSALSQMHNLEHLYLYSSAFEDAQIVSSLENLRYLSIQNDWNSEQTSVQNLEKLAKLKNLERLSLYNVDVDDATLRALQSALPSCEIQT